MLETESVSVRIYTIHFNLPLLIFIVRNIYKKNSNVGSFEFVLGNESWGFEPPPTYTSAH